MDYTISEGLLNDIIKALEPLDLIAKAYENCALDEHCPQKGNSPFVPNVSLFQEIGGKTMLSRAQAYKAQRVLTKLKGKEVPLRTVSEQLPVHLVIEEIARHPCSEFNIVAINGTMRTTLYSETQFGPYHSGIRMSRETLLDIVSKKARILALGLNLTLEPLVDKISAEIAATEAEIRTLSEKLAKMQAMSKAGVL